MHRDHPNADLAPWRARRAVRNPRACGCAQCRAAGARHGEADEELGSLYRKAAGAVSSTAERLGQLLGPPRIQDRTAVSARQNRKHTRDQKDVYALVLHQMAFSRGNDPSRYDRVNSHFAILPDGAIIQLHPVSALLWASNGFNARSVAVEFAGNFPNVRGHCWSPQTNGCHRVTDAQIRAGRQLVLHLRSTIGLTHVLAHRQSSGTRENDPGPDLWYHVGQWAIDTLGLRDGGPGFKVGTGAPLPDAWRTWGRRGQPGFRNLAFELGSISGSDGELADELTLWRGLRGPEVTDLQQRLNARGSYQLAVDGQFGPATDAAVRSFQGANGLAVDGIVGPATWAALGAAAPGSYVPPAPGRPAPAPPSGPAGTNWSAVRADPADIVTAGPARVNRIIAAQVTDLFRAAAADGAPLAVSSSWRTREEQIGFRREFCGPSQSDIFEKPPSACNPPTAIPGTSRHEQGLAIDFAVPTGGKLSTSTPQFRWLAANAAKFGLFNYPKEAWHWSVDGR